MRKVFQASILAFVVSLSFYGSVFALDISGAQPCGKTSAKAPKVVSPFDASVNAIDNAVVYVWMLDGSSAGVQPSPNPQNPYQEFNVAKLPQPSQLGIHTWSVFSNYLDNGQTFGTTTKTCYVKVTSICDPDKAVCIKNPLSSNSFTDLTDTILDFVFNIALVAAPLMVVIAGFLFVTGGGDPLKLKRARDILLWTAIGFSIILVSKGIPFLIKDILGVK